MKLSLLRVSSPDLQPEVEGSPSDSRDFDIEIEVMLAPKGHEGRDVSFHFWCVSPSALMRRPVGAFLPNILLMEEFSWSEIRRHIDKLLMQVHSCSSWECVAVRLSPYMRPFGAVIADSKL